MIRLYDKAAPFQRQQDIPYARSTYPGGEIYVRVEADAIRSKPVTIHWKFERNDELIEIALLVNALQYAGQINVELECPYLPYARQDRVCKHGESFSLEVIAAIINSIGFSSVTVWDVHNPAAARWINNLVNVPLGDLVTKLNWPMRLENCIVIAPDQGAIYRANSIGKQFGHKTIYASKVRAPDTGAVTIDLDANLIPDGADVLIVDDICDGGRTFIELAKQIPDSKGKLYLLVTHGIFSAGFDELRKHIDHILVVNPMCGVPEDYVTVI
jgi:ribose-phosphate pyrophosphokinase